MYTIDKRRGAHALWPLHIFIDKRKTMIVAPGGISIEQKVETVANNDAAINAAIAASDADNWLVTSLTLSGSDVIILFTRTSTAA